MCLSRRIALAGCALLILGCSTPPIRYGTTPFHAEKVDELLRARPDDADLLFLRHEAHALAVCDKLAALRPTPLVLASVVDKHISDGVDVEELGKFKDLLKRWIDCDSDNGMAVLIQGLLAVTMGDLKGGMEILVQASHLPGFRTYALDSGREMLRILQKEGLEEIEFLVDAACSASLANSRLSACALSAFRLLADSSREHYLRGHREMAIRLAEAEFRMARAMRSTVAGLADVWYADWRIADSGARLCELHLQDGNQDLAQKFATHSRNASLDYEMWRAAAMGDSRNDPVSQLRKEAKGPVKSKDPWESLILSGEESNRFWELIRKNETRIRPLLEDQIRRGYVPTILGGLSETDRKAVEARVWPIDRFWKERSDFYPKSYGAENRKFLLNYLSAPGFDEDCELAGFLQERAKYALIHHRDVEALPEARRFDDSSFAVVRAAFGERSERLREILEADEPSDPAACWALAKIGSPKSVPSLVKALVLDIWSRKVDTHFQEAVAAYFALVDLTGQDFGFDDDKWHEWAKGTGNWKE